MRVKLVNKFTGTVMFVDEARADEYMAAGHKPVAVSVDKPVKSETKAPAKRTTKKKTEA